MKSRIEWERMISGRLYCPFRVGDDSAARVHAAQKRFNDSEFWHDRVLCGRSGGLAAHPAGLL